MTTEETQEKKHAYMTAGMVVLLAGFGYVWPLALAVSGVLICIPLGFCNMALVSDNREIGIKGGPLPLFTFLGKQFVADIVFVKKDLQKMLMTDGRQIAPPLKRSITRRHALPISAMQQFNTLARSADFTAYKRAKPMPVEALNAE